MARKKVKKDKIPPPTTKERVKEDVETKKIITYLSNNTKNRWNKIKGVEGEVVRFKINDTKRQEFLKDKRCELLYVGVDNDILYYYYNIKK
jgi:hypothetical protein|tara:strand:- start:213 stop:485 length:273 start_codon:yes stop_codon:yes gene_type:complete